MAAIVLSGCSQTSEQLPQSDPEDGHYLIYYTNQEGTGLKPAAYDVKNTETEALVEELIEQLEKQSKDITIKPVLSEGINVKSFSMENDRLDLNFESGYNALSPTEEILCRAALVKTLIQVPEVSCVEIKVDDQPLLDANGQPVGIMTGESFVDTMDGSIYSMQSIDLILYFANENGDGLVEEDRTVLYNNDLSLEKLVLTQLISGPKREDARPVLPGNLKVLTTSVKDGVCYVNFDSSFVSGVMDVSDEVAIYALVNSLAELNNVGKVQFTVNGSSDYKFQDSIDLSKPFERNLDFVGGFHD